MKKKNHFFIFFPIRIFSWKTDKFNPKRGKSDKHMCLRPIYNFCEKKKSTLKILNCVKVNTIILVIFSIYFVIYTSNLLKWCCFCAGLPNFICILLDFLVILFFVYFFTFFSLFCLIFCCFSSNSFCFLVFLFKFYFHFCFIFY